MAKRRWNKDLICSGVLVLGAWVTLWYGGSISKAKKLYKALITRVHPDKFQNDKNEKANELASRITTAKRNYDELCKLEIEVGQFLKDSSRII